jgi:hypothetical protein
MQLEQEIPQEVEMRNSLMLQDSEAVDTSTGVFLLLDRFFYTKYTLPDTDELVLVYRVQHSVSSHEFYSALEAVSSKLYKQYKVYQAGVVSDHLVSAFDHDLAALYNKDHGLWAFLNSDGRLVHQHST